MNASLYNGIAGVKTSQFGIDVLADNIANIETPGFIGKTAEFSSVFSTVIGTANTITTTNDFGYGVRAGAASLNTWQKGVLTPTDNTFDLALDGRGWFGVQNGNETFYTRAGAFSVDTNGDLVDINGNYLLGTSGNNITPTTLDDTTMQKLGKYYTSDSTQLLDVYNVTALNNITIGTVSNQTKINLPDALYLPPEATTYINYKANLNPEITTSVTQIDLENTDIGTPSVNTTTNELSLSGTVSNTSALQDPQIGDIIILTVTDANGESINVNTELTTDTNGNLVWNFSNTDISALDTAALTYSAKLQTTQEIPNTEHFATEVISPDGDKNIVDLTFTKQVPQTSLETTWNATAQLLSYYEDYTIETYDSSKTYDPTIYNVDLGTNQVTKIYDSTLYKVNTSTNKVYQILDSGTGTATFAGSGALLSSNMPTLSNGGTPLTLNIGNPENGFGGLVSNVDLDKARLTQTDGYIEGFLSDYGMDGNGNIIAEFDNGRISALAKVGIYQFQNEQGLENVSATLFRQSANSGDPLFFINENGTNYRGTTIQSNYLEGSNVSYSTALTELIVMQKAFDSSAKSITTSDQLIQNAINMKK